MKKFRFLAFAAAGMLLAACSTNDEAVSGNPLEGEGEKYIAVGINLPTVPVTRATTENGNVTLEDGLASEYDVKDVTLIIFGNDNKFKEAYDLTTQWEMDDNDSHVTKTSGKVIQKVGGTVKEGDKLLIVLNKNGFLSFNADTNGFEVNGKPFTKEKTFSDFQQTLAETEALYAGNMTGAGFYMTNAPLVNKAGSTAQDDCSGASVQVLVSITSIFKSFDEAKSATTVDQIYVERGMAKVTLEYKNGNLTGEGVQNMTYSITGWTLDNTNKKSYLVRSTDGHSDFAKLKSEVNGIWRYAGNTAITTGSPTEYKYRSYFAMDPNYDRDAKNDLTKATKDDYKTEFGENNPQYCYENTFSVPFQNEDQTTLARVKIQVKQQDAKEAEDLYTLNGVKSTVYTLTTLTTHIQEIAYDLMTDKPNSSTDINVTFGEREASKGIVKIKELTCTGKTAPSVDDVAAKIGEIVCYKDGNSYYTIRIKHFGSGTDAECLTPWNTTENTKPVVGNIYPEANRDNNYLGRYGVLRNNWYDLQVESIKYLGDAEPKAPTDTTDDEIDAYITFQINVLSWAKRVQGWSF